jgi:hypothetical protein
VPARADGDDGAAGQGLALLGDRVGVAAAGLVVVEDALVEGGEVDGGEEASR